LNEEQEGGLVWEKLHNAFGAELPADLFREILESRRQTMIAARQWPADKPLPDPEQFVARKLLDSTLAEMGYVPAKLDAEDASPDREPQPCNDIRHGVGHHDETRNVPFTGAKRAHHVDENAIGVAHPLIGVDQNRKQRSDKYDPH